ncbi:Nucleotidyl transferase [Cynara cardunculus var. scolymus]|uniref:glucose-1-phosphate adenylyltransferase n=1 Tax=Cynara cardunculus var. scolymus TaxID=59895 RepID=A0A103PYX0_CYNCS|nr:Nucleotidyl transferase [Cynara cardunculus var. scolymus]
MEKLKMETPTYIILQNMGTADAVRQYLWLFEEHNVLEFLILAGNHLYRMDYERFIQAHRETDAGIIVAALPMDEKRATAFGVMKIDEEGRTIEFAEKPKGEKLKAMKVDTTILGLDEQRAKEMPYIASMGIYEDKFPGANDFGSEVIPGATSIGLRVCFISFLFKLASILDLTSLLV